MQVHAQRCGLKWPEPLTEQGRDYSRQHIARAAGRHAGIARAVDVNPRAVGDHGTGPLQDDDAS